MSRATLLSRIYRRLIRPIMALEKFCYAIGILKPDGLTLPDFLCIGTEKAGTTWLYENLRMHPDIYLPVRKELNFFWRNYWFYCYPLSFYAKYFSRAPINAIIGEFTPYSTMSLSRIRFVGKIMPNVKLILILRNPVDRLWSASLMILIRSQKRIFDEITYSEFLQLMSKKELLAFGLYPDILKNWRTVFPEHQIKVLFYDDLVRDPKNYLMECFDFLGAKPVASFEKFQLTERINKGPDYPMPMELRKHFYNIYKPSILELSKEFGDKVRHWLDPD